MRISESATKPNVVEVTGLARLYATTLEGRGYKQPVVLAYARAVEHFIAWVGPKAGHVEIKEVLIERFLDRHLDGCDCPGNVHRGKVTCRSALKHLVAILRAADRLAPLVSVLPDYIHSEVREYCDYASDICGLAPATLISRRQWISRFLAHLFPKRGVQISKLAPTNVRRFFIAQCAGYRPGSAQVVASSIRSYLRFRAMLHADPVESLIAAIPLAARWRLAPLPGYLEPAELTTLLTAFNQAHPQNQRDYAIIRCLLDLGLRSCEVAALRLEDLDWESGTLTIRVGKSHRMDVLPLPSITGQSIVAYLRTARPVTESRAVFIRHRAPLHLPVDACVIRSVVRQAAARSGLTHRLHGPHLLRHSAATRMLQGGATLKEIADVLRHRSLDTTAIYAKVDVSRLAGIAQPWPGSAA